MGDALSDISRETERSENYSVFLEGLFNYLKDPSQENYEHVKKSAENTDSIKGGYFNLGSNLSGGLEKRINKLREGDKVSWSRLLCEIERDYDSYHNFYSDLKTISPFKDRHLVFVDYGIGFSNIGPRGDIHEIIGDKDFRIFDGDKYLVSFSKESGEISVIWFHGARMRSNFPRDLKGNPREN